MKPEDYMIAVTGDPLRTNAYVFAHNGVLGYTVGKRIQLPKARDRRLKDTSAQKPDAVTYQSGKSLRDVRLQPRGQPQ